MMNDRLLAGRAIEWLAARGPLARLLLPLGGLVVAAAVVHRLVAVAVQQALLPAWTGGVIDFGLIILVVGASVWATRKFGQAPANAAAKPPGDDEQERYRQLVETSRFAIVVTNEDRIEFANAAALALVGAASPDAVVGRSPLDFADPSARDLFATHLRRVLYEGTPLPPVQYRLRRVDGSPIDIEISAAPMQSGGRRLVQVMAHDITARQQAELALRKSEEQFRLITENMTEVFWMTDRNIAHSMYVSAAYERVWGRSRKSLYEDHAGFAATIYPDDRERVCALVANDEKQGRAFEHEYRIVRPDGTLRWIWDRGFPVRNEAGEILNYVGVAMDITERKQAEQQLHLLAQALENANEMISITSLEHRFLFVNRAFLVQYGYTLAEILGQTPDILATAPGQSGPLLDAIRTRCASGSSQFELTNRRKDGTTLQIHLSTSPIRDSNGSVVALIGVARDVTEQRRTIENLRSSDERFRVLFEQAAVGIALVALDGRFIRANDKYSAVTGYTPAELLGRSFQEITHPDDLARDMEHVRRLIAGDFASFTVEKRYVRKEGAVVWVKVTVSLVQHADGSPDYFIALVDDITASRELESQLRQNQKMEAIGQLAGGIAHDFNNLLMAIRGHVDLINLSRDVPAPIRESLDEINRATQRASSLTRQLLLFSRREVIQPRQLNLNDSILGITKMLGRLLGEEINLQLQLHHAPLPIRADPGMIDQVVLNLAVNARDAMQGRGNLAITTTAESVDAATAKLSEASAGRYACLNVSDTGCGIAPDVLPHIFEPFFTTKPRGQGTGLGLATMFGIVKQHGGWVRVVTAQGKGTTFRVFLPLTDVPAEADAPRPAPVPQGRGETILLVEDDEAVRLMASMLMQRQGYHVIVAGNAVEALERWSELGGRVDLLVTDMIMPGGMNGTELAAKLQEHHPKLPVVLTSGYNAELAGRVLELRPNQMFLQKPFECRELLSAIENLLGAAQRS